MKRASEIRARAGHAPLRAERICAERESLLALRASNLHLLPSIMGKFEATFEQESGNGRQRWLAYKGQHQQEAADLMLIYDVVHILMDAGYFVAIYNNAETTQATTSADGKMDPTPAAPQETHVLLKGWRLWVSWHADEPQYLRDCGRTVPTATRCGIFVMDKIHAEDESVMCEMMQLVGGLRQATASRAVPPVDG